MEQKAFNQAARFVKEVDTLMAALYRASTIVTEIQSAGLTYADADFVDTALSHLTAAQLDSAISNLVALRTHLETGFIDDVFNAVRP
jgi:hypothetical protein